VISFLRFKIGYIDLTTDTDLPPPPRLATLLAEQRTQVQVSKQSRKSTLFHPVSALTKGSCIPAVLRKNVHISKATVVNPSSLHSPSDSSRVASVTYYKTVRRTVKLKWHPSVKHGKKSSNIYRA